MDAKFLLSRLSRLAGHLLTCVAATTPVFAGDGGAQSGAASVPAIRCVSTTPSPMARLYQVKSETQITDAKVSRSETTAYNLPVAVEGDAIILRPAEEGAVRYRVVGHRYVYQASGGEGEMQTGAPALVATRTEAGRIEILTLTPQRLTLLRSLAALDGYILTTACFVGERPVSAADPAVPQGAASASRDADP